MKVWYNDKMDTQKIAIIVQRYGLEINGGAEYHARLIAEKLSPFFSVEVFTSTALDYITWAHHYPEGVSEICGLPVRRFKVRHPRDPERFGAAQRRILETEHSLEDELHWLEEEGPFLPDLMEELEKRECEFAYFIFFSYRYYHSYRGVQRFPEKAILVPTAEHDDVIYLRLFKHIFNQPAAIIYNSHEEKELIHKISGNENVLGEIVGVGSEIPSQAEPELFRQKYHIEGKYFVYIGRLDENKGVPELLQFYLRLQEEKQPDLTLALMGKSVITVPEHPRIRFLGFVTDQMKFNALAGSEFLVIPSQFESLSMVALEAWAMGKPVVANGRTEVLQGQCRRSNAGLWYSNYDEFREIMLLLADSSPLKSAMGKNGKNFFEQNYSWDVIVNKYLEIIRILNLRNRVSVNPRDTSGL